MHTTPILNANELIVDWYLIPESFSATFVENAMAAFKTPRGGVVLDPFSGAGTTAVAAKLSGRQGIGIEINPFLCFAARVKTNFAYDIASLRQDVAHLLSEVSPMLESLSVQKSLFTASTVPLKVGGNRVSMSET